MQPTAAARVALTMLLAVSVPAAARPAPRGGRTPAAATVDAEAQEQAALKRKAQQLLTEGNQLAATGDFLSALNKFRAAHELFPSPRLLLNIGTSLRQLGRFAEAASSYEQYLSSDEAGGENAAAARKALDELGELVGYLVVELPEPGARVLLDGQLITEGELGVPLRVDPGGHTLIAEKEGRPATVRQVDVSAQETVGIALPIAQPGEAPPEPIPVRPIAGYSVAALGGAAVAVAVVLAIMAGATDADADDECAAGGVFAGYCSEEGARLTAKAHDLGVASLVAGLAGAAAGIAGITIAVTTPEEPDTGPTREPQPADPGPSVERAGLVISWRGVW